MATDNGTPAVDDEWEVKPPPKKAGGSDEWTTSAPGVEAQQAAALGPSTMAASRAQTMAPLTPDQGGNLPGTLGHAVYAGYREPAEDPEAQVEASKIGGYMGMAGGVGGGARMIAEKGLRAAAGPIIRGVSGAVAGTAAGGYGGRQIGGMFSPKAAERGGHIGATLGGLAGGIYGGMQPEPVPEPEFSDVSKSSGPYRGPSSVPTPIAPEPPLGSPENPGLMSKIPTGRNSMPKIAPVLGSPENPGLTSPIPTGRGSMRLDPSIAPGPRVPKGGLPVPEGPKLFNGGGGAREPGRVGNEGSAARFTNQSAYDKAKQGSREAIMTLGRRGIEPPPNSRYIMGDVDTDRVVYNPREVTKFGPTGEPIRNMQAPEKGSRSVIAAPGGVQGTPVPVPGNGDITDREVHDRLLQLREEKLKQDINKYAGPNDRRSATAPKGPRKPRPGQ
jgi:hypothetical protein